MTNIILYVRINHQIKKYQMKGKVKQMENTIKNSQANEIMNTIARNICIVLGNFTEENFIDNNIEVITEIVNEATRDTFITVCEILNIEGVEED